MNCTTVLPFAAPITYNTDCRSLIEPSYHHSSLNSSNILVRINCELNQLQHRLDKMRKHYKTMLSEDYTIVLKYFWTHSKVEFRF